MPISGKRTATIRLDGAVITGINASAALTGNSSHVVEEVSFSYMRITFTTFTETAPFTTTVCFDVALAKTC